MQQAKPRNDRRTCCPDKPNRRGTDKHRKPTWRRARGKLKRSKCPRTATSAASAPSPEELLDRESPQEGLLSATQLTQVQSIVQGSLNEAIEKAASAAAQAAVSAFSGSSTPATALSTPARVRVVQYTPSDTIGKSLISIRTDGQVGSTREKGLSIREMNVISGT